MIKMLKPALVVATLSSMLSTPVMAEGEVGSGPNPFTDCGIGAALFPSTGWAAVSSNVIWDIGITALTSATASPETCSKKKVQAALFIRDAYPSVIEQTASGQGEHLTAMLQIFGCPTESHSEIIQSVRNKVGASVSSDNYQSKEDLQKASDYYNVINDTVANNFASSCSV